MNEKKIYYRVDWNVKLSNEEIYKYQFLVGNYEMYNTKLQMLTKKIFITTIVYWKFIDDSFFYYQIYIMTKGCQWKILKHKYSFRSPEIKKEIIFISANISTDSIKCILIFVRWMYLNIYIINNKYLLEYFLVSKK